VISIDTNILLPAVETENAQHARAAAFLESLGDSSDVAISEFILLELYGLLRNPAVLRRPLAAKPAVAICEALRSNPRWQCLGLPPESRPFHDELWRKLDDPGLARRRAYDVRIGLSLVAQGVTDFATVNLKDFRGLGFATVWNPLAR
jgi:uncharacterized protein